MPTPEGDPRNSIDGPRAGLFRCYVAAVTTAGVGATCLVLLGLDWSRVLHLGPAFWAVCGLLLLGEARPLFTAGTRDSNGLSLSAAFVFALLLRYDLGVALAAQTIAMVMADLPKRKAPWRTAFNVGQFALSWMAAWGVIHLLAQPGSVHHPRSLSQYDLLAACGGAAAYFATNQFLVGRALSLRVGAGIWALLRPDLGYELLTAGSLLALSPLVVLSMAAGPLFVPLLVPPLAAVYVVASVALAREQQALTDTLTGLANRKRLAECTVEIVEDGVAALVLLDLDRFKEVNDTLGHHVGDQLLRVVAQRLQTAVRPQDVVARLGGDEFALLLPDTDAAGALIAAQRARLALVQPIVLEGLLIDVSASAGVSVAPIDGTELDALLQHADVAMYLSKESGEVELYDSTRDRNTPVRLALLGELRRALETDQLELHYQPKADVLSGEVVGVEALVRWRHPEHGLVQPDDFVPLAERSGLVQLLTAWVLDTGLTQLAAWRARGWDLTLAVNITIKDLCGDSLVDAVAAGLATHGIPASALQLEVTEGSLFADPVRARSTLRRLEAMGIALSLDDFGTGWSSLRQLRELPVREIKVDRSFVSRMDTDPRDLAVVVSVIDLARGLGMQVVAEGVEDLATWQRLVEMGCDIAQGWWLSKALPGPELTEWLSARLAAPPDCPSAGLAQGQSSPAAVVTVATIPAR